MLTSRDAMRDELHAIEIGADDYLTKPCHPDRLIARVQRLLRTYDKLHNILQLGEIALDFDTGKVIFKDSSVVLTNTECKMLRLLIEQYPAVVSKEDLFIELWGGLDYLDENILQVNITRLRKSLDSIGLKNAVHTVRGYGYRWELLSE
jgi:DNA-binding response OmpR family regulator